MSETLLEKAAGVIHSIVLDVLNTISQRPEPIDTVVLARNPRPRTVMRWPPDRLPDFGSKE